MPRCLGDYLAGPAHRPEWRRVDRLRGARGLRADTPAARRKLERRELAQAKAERILAEELRRLGWREADLASRCKRDPGKLEIAVRLHQETTLSEKQIAARLHLGTPGSASVCLLAALRKTIAGTSTQGSLECKEPCKEEAAPFDFYDPF